jgi:hypothetical protein
MEVRVRSFVRSSVLLLVGLALVFVAAHVAIELGVSSPLQRIAVSCAVAGVLVGGGGAYLAALVRRMVATLQREAQRLRDATAAGQLELRATPDAVAPELRPIVEVMNETMDALERPTRSTAERRVRFGKGEIPSPSSEGHAGVFGVIEQSLNGCITAIDALAADAGKLAQAGVEGRLGVRADAARHQGDFRTIVQGVNDALDAVAGPLRDLADGIDALSRGDVPPPIVADHPGDFILIREVTSAGSWRGSTPPSTPWSVRSARPPVRWPRSRPGVSRARSPRSTGATSSGSGTTSTPASRP